MNAPVERKVVTKRTPTTPYTDRSVTFEQGTIEISYDRTVERWRLVFPNGAIAIRKCRASATKAARAWFENHLAATREYRRDVEIGLGRILWK